jgi:hypothetical protein
MCQLYSYELTDYTIALRQFLCMRRFGYSLTKALHAIYAASEVTNGFCKVCFGMHP